MIVSNTAPAVEVTLSSAVPLDCHERRSVMINFCAAYHLISVYRHQEILLQRHPRFKFKDPIELLETAKDLMQAKAAANIVERTFQVSIQR